MPSSTSLLEADDGESEVPPPPLVHAFAGMGLDEHLATQSQKAVEQTNECPALYHHNQFIPASHYNILGTVLDLKPLQRRPTSVDDGTATPEDEDLQAPTTSGSPLLSQAHQYIHPSGPSGSVMPSALDQVETVLLYNGEDRGDDVGVYCGEPGGGGCFEAEALLLARRKSVNTTECVEVPSSEHVAEIVGRQGCKIKALRAKTNTYIKTPVRGEKPIFVVTGRKEDVCVAKREILSAAEHFSLIRASRSKAGSLSVVSGPGIPALPGQTTIQVRVPYRVVGLVVGPKGATIKRIQQQTHTYIVTPSRDKEPVFEVTGMPENVDHAREEIEAHIALRTGACGGGAEVPGGDDNDFQFNGTDVSFDNIGEAGWLRAGGLLPANPDTARRTNAGGGIRMSSSYRNDSSSSLGSGSSSNDSFYGGGSTNRMADFSPTCSFNANSNNNNNNNDPVATSFWFGDGLPPVGSEEAVAPASWNSSAGFEPLTISTSQLSHSGTPPHIWSPFVDHQSLQALDAHPVQTSQPGTPRLSPTFPGAADTFEQPQALHARLVPFAAHRPPSYCSPFSSSGDSSSSSPPEPSLTYGAGAAPRPEACIRCADGRAVAALVPCGHNLFCPECAAQICRGPDAACPVCLSPVTRALRLRNV
ncbi:RNA-binding protein MEX3B-like [Corythoichthys intestinalis]|uniref:RNA-binding protein MEX3B-like n=1 Tax=Corythoichthys intestinalis TaxID=161448 RepID=UPI0025A5C42C|nr:RNA-binding protein MEX3B-like [Corythoichthys intestinalis]XP_061804223.1 RNA-binding protein MEX3B-like [Nerophis lumbriciformis]